KRYLGFLFSKRKSELKTSFSYTNQSLDKNTKKAILSKQRKKAVTIRQPFDIYARSKPRRSSYNQCQSCDPGSCTGKLETLHYPIRINSAYHHPGYYLLSR